MGVIGSFFLAIVQPVSPGAACCLSFARVDAAPQVPEACLVTAFQGLKRLVWCAWDRGFASLLGHGGDRVPFFGCCPARFTRRGLLSVFCQGWFRATGSGGLSFAMLQGLKRLVLGRLDRGLTSLLGFG